MIFSSWFLFDPVCLLWIGLVSQSPEHDCEKVSCRDIFFWLAATDTAAVLADVFSFLLSDTGTCKRHHLVRFPLPLCCCFPVTPPFHCWAVCSVLFSITIWLPCVCIRLCHEHLPVGQKCILFARRCENVNTDKPSILLFAKFTKTGGSASF